MHSRKEHVSEASLTKTEKAAKHSVKAEVPMLIGDTFTCKAEKEIGEMFEGVKQAEQIIKEEPFLQKQFETLS